jgi:hypothetical protein
VTAGRSEVPGEEGGAGWRPLRRPLTSADDGRFILDHFLRQFCNPFDCIRSEADLYDETLDRATAEAVSLADFEALQSGTPDEFQRELGSFLASCLADDAEADLRWAAPTPLPASPDVVSALSETRRIRAADPFRPRLSPDLELHLLRNAAGRHGHDLPPSIVASTASRAPVELPVRRSREEHEARYRQYVERLRALRRLNLRNRQARDHPVLIVGAGPAGLIRAVSAVLRGLPVTVLELRPEQAAKRPQIVVIRSHAVIALLEQIGVIDFLFMENRIFPLGRLKLEVSLADLELAFVAILRAVAQDEPAFSIHYGTTIERIEQADGLARVHALRADGTPLSFSPRLIVIADGRHSPTSALLGISRIDRFHSHTGIIAIFRAAEGLAPHRRWAGELASKLNYAFHRYVSRKGRGLLAGTILQVPGHHYLGLDLARDDELRLRDALARSRAAQSSTNEAPNGSADIAATDEVRGLIEFWSNYGFEAIRTKPVGTAPHTGGRPISWLPLDPQFAMPIEVVSDRADAFCGHIGETFVLIEGDAQFTIHPGSAYGCTKAFLSARLFDFVLRARSSAPDGRAPVADRLFAYNAEFMVRACDNITRLFRVTA